MLRPRTTGAGRAAALDLAPASTCRNCWPPSRARRRQLGNELAERLPRGLADAWVPRDPVGSGRWPTARRRAGELAERLQAWQSRPTAPRATARPRSRWAADTRDPVVQQTLESRLQPGLYFIGEVVDVTGWLGGYNFQWAWASAAACAGPWAGGWGRLAAPGSRHIIAVFAGKTRAAIAAAERDRNSRPSGFAEQHFSATQP